MTVISSHSVSTVAGSWINGASMVTGGGLHRVLNPATGRPSRSALRSSPGDVDSAVASARAALEHPGRHATPVDRSAVLFKLARAGRRARRRPGRRGGQPDGKAGAAGKRVRRSRKCRQHRLLRRRRPSPRRQGQRGSIPPITRRAFVVRRWESSRPSPPGTTRSRWPCGRLLPALAAGCTSGHQTVPS